MLHPLCNIACFIEMSIGKWILCFYNSALKWDVRNRDDNISIPVVKMDQSFHISLKKLGWWNEQRGDITASGWFICIVTVNGCTCGTDSIDLPHDGDVTKYTESYLYPNVCLLFSRTERSAAKRGAERFCPHFTLQHSNSMVKRWTQHGFYWVRVMIHLISMI